ncbi:hypothetical protein ACEYYA_00800 [Paracoccus sp. p3-h83]|uniref:hypothetical protein n=1 Tax=Paracoccus sp. p3-h83 TaxID=3342805 RepID=UPI0035BACD12
MSTTVTRIEKRKRGVFGWLFLLLFIGFNLLMLFAFISGVGGSAEQASHLTTEAERAGAALGTALGAGFLLSIWAAGAIILGIIVMLTRGKKIITETQT